MGDNMGLIQHKCKFCRKEYKDYFADSKYCSTDCYKNFRKINAKLVEKKCPICEKLFKPKNSSIIYCSKKCVDLGKQKRYTCICNYCGKKFTRIRSEVIKNSKHYCSKKCKLNDVCWSKEAEQILLNNYGKLPYSEILRFIDRDINAHSIYAKTKSMGITKKTSFWSDEEIKILIDNYSVKPMNEMLLLLPNRSRSAILGHARKYNLKSYFYLNRIYTDEETEYIKTNYIKKTYEEMSKELNRSITAIKLRMYALNLHKPINKEGYNDLYDYVRNKIFFWKNSIKEKCNYTCAITGSRSNIVLHHIRSFNLLMEECIEILDFPLHDDFNSYSQNELDYFVDIFLIIQDFYGEYICITEDVHKKFHAKYGYGNNTKKQWDEFVLNYKK